MFLKIKHANAARPQNAARRYSLDCGSRVSRRPPHSHSFVMGSSAVLFLSASPFILCLEGGNRGAESLGDGVGPAVRVGPAVQDLRRLTV